MGVMIDWYDVLMVGMLFVIGFMYMLVVVGIYYVEIRVLVDDCVSFVCMVIILIIDLILMVDDV